MFRVVDVERALALMRHPQGCGRYVLKTADAFLPENDGTYAVEYENGAAVLVQRTEEAPDLEVDVTTLAQLMMGYADLKTLAMRKDVTIHGNRGNPERRIHPQGALFSAIISDTKNSRTPHRKRNLFGAVRR